MGDQPDAKAKKKSKTSKKIDVVVPAEETEYDRMDLEMLREVVPMLHQQLGKSRLDRNYVQLERDSIQQYFDVTRREVSEMELALAAKEREMEMAENNQRITLRIYEQKVKHLEYNHKNTIHDIISSNENTTLTSTKALDIEKNKILEKSKEQLKNEQLEIELENVKRVADIRVLHEKYLSKLSSQFEEGLRELILRCEARKDAIETDYELRRRVDVHEVEERKNLHVNELINNHKKSFNSMKDYYNKITFENLNLVKSLQGQVRELKSRADNNKATLLQCKQENDRLTDLSAKEANRMTTLQAQLRQRKNDKLALKNALSRQADIEKKLKISSEEFHTLQLEYSAVEKEHAELCDTFEENIRLAQNQSSTMNQALEYRLKALRDTSSSSALATTTVNYYNPNDDNLSMIEDNGMKSTNEGFNNMKKINNKNNSSANSKASYYKNSHQHPPSPPIGNNNNNNNNIKKKNNNNNNNTHAASYDDVKNYSSSSSVLEEENTTDGEFIPLDDESTLLLQQHSQSQVQPTESLASLSSSPLEPQT